MKSLLSIVYKYTAGLFLVILQPLFIYGFLLLIPFGNGGFGKGLAASELTHNPCLFKFPFEFL